MINLSKNASISLSKSEKPLDEICIGVNWGQIVNKSFFGLIKEYETVDLDCSVSMFDDFKEEIDTVYYYQLVSNDSSIKHSGDDRSGDISDDDKDNEIIHIKLDKVSKNISSVFIYLNSYKNQDFSNIPYAKIRVIEGTPKKIKSIFAQFDLTLDKKFEGYTSVVLAKLIRINNSWEFVTIGEPIRAYDISGIIKVIQQNFL